ncbi:MKL/myocardin-like protein 2 [Araneus ventricosus]|uniref:MKL/myocardin-like protein 2 n=1 Tax=Araneus ventricosus TaxID=182803 RepID=A0A4Y2FXN5_ARAVE|nr:MKL/myocardin-like protein 2 [Araneus ventricosus]
MTEQDDQDCANFQNMIDSYLSTRDSKSPPKAQVDEASLQQAMDKNKESLKVKLMMRRPINQLVEQGIMPSPKKPLRYLQQCQKLERAKTENILKNLMKTRPDRQALIDHHILEDTTIDPSLQDKQRQLKKARLADDLNDRLSHRPGPLELIKGNILHTDEKFAQAVKEGQIPFKRTCEGQALRHPAPCFIFEDDSGSDAALSPPQDVLDHSLGSMPSVESMVLSPYPNQDSPTSSMGELRIASSTPPSSQSSPAPSQTGNVPSQNEVPQKESSTSSTTRRKKSKPKAPPKTRTIKFHEYKGPPSAQKSQASQSLEETSYELLLQQQQLFLQWQLEMQQKYPQVILPVPQQPPGDQSKSTNAIQNSTIEKPQDTTNTSSPTLVKNLEDLKVNGLKAECKKRNLPVSGSKNQLLERLRNHMESSNNKSTQEKNNCAALETTAVPVNMSGIILDTLPTLVTQQAPVTSVVTVNAPMINNRASQITLGDGTETLMVYNTMPVQGQIVTSRPSSTAPMDVEMNSNADIMDCTENTTAMNEEIVKRQQQKIMQLERELERSQRQLQHQWWQQQQQQAQQQVQQQVLLASHPVPIAPAPPSNHVSMATALPQPTVAQAVVQSQLLQPKAQLNTAQQLLQQANKYTPGSAGHNSALVKASLAAFIHNQQANSVRLRNGLAAPNQQNISQFTNLKPIVLCQAQTVPAVLEKPRANSLPNGIAQQKMVWSSSVPNFSNVIAPKIAVGTIDPKFLLQKAPPDYNEVVKPQIKIKQEKSSGSKRSGRKSVKSQEVDDVLDVLISHGELPPSAAQEPPTPTTPETQKGSQAPPAFPSVGDIKPTLSVSSPPNINTPEQPIDPSLKLNDPPNPQEERNDPNPPLVFDLNLDFQDLEAMDLGVLDRNDMNDPTSQSSSSKSDSLQQQQQTQNNCAPSYSDLDMDVEFTDWLDILTNNNSVSNANQNRISSFNGDNSDPLLPSMDSGQETLDMFSLDNLDFKLPSDSNLLSWDKIDYAT